MVAKMYLYRAKFGHVMATAHRTNRNSAEAR